MSSGLGKPRAGRLEYEPELPDDVFIEHLKLQEKNAKAEQSDEVAAVWWAAQHAYRVLVLRQQPHFTEDV